MPHWQFWRRLPLLSHSSSSSSSLSQSIAIILTHNYRKIITSSNSQYLIINFVTSLLRSNHIHISSTFSLDDIISTTFLTSSNSTKFTLTGGSEERGDVRKIMRSSTMDRKWGWNDENLMITTSSSPSLPFFSTWLFHDHSLMLISPYHKMVWSRCHTSSPPYPPPLNQWTSWDRSWRGSLCDEVSDDGYIILSSFQLTSQSHPARWERGIIWSTPVLITQ